MDHFDSDIKITMVETAPLKPLKRKRSNALTSWVTSSFDGFDLPPKSEKKTANRNHKQDLKQASCSPSESFDVNDLLSDQYRPTKRTDLCVHVRKVAEVDTWLKNALSAPSGSRRILLITGPSGCGKTATLRCLCDQRNIDLREWNNPLGGNEMEKLEQFLFRSDRYGGDVICGDESEVGTSGEAIVLLEDLPPAIGNEPELLRKLLRRHARDGRIPLILILSDSSTRELSPRWILPKTILDELHIDTIRFNPVAPTQLKKALQRVADSEGRKRRGKTRFLSAASLAELVTECGGDIRCALNRLQFVLTQPASQFNNESKSESSNEETKGLSANENDKCSNRVEPLPPHLSCHRRDPLSFNPEDVFERSRLPGTLFATFLHENCPDFFADITELSDGLDTFSLSDRIGSVWCADRPPGTQLADLYVGPLTGRGLSFYKQRAQSVGFRPMRRPQLLSLPNLLRGTETRPLLLDIQPYQRILRNRGRRCRLAHSTRFGGSLMENDTAYEDSTMRKYKVRHDQEEESVGWTIAVEQEHETVIIDDPDS